MREPKKVTMYQWSKKDLVESLEEALGAKRHLHGEKVALTEQNHKIADIVIQLKAELTELAKERYDLASQLGEAHKAIVKLVLGDKP